MLAPRFSVREVLGLAVIGIVLAANVIPLPEVQAAYESFEPVTGNAYFGFT